MIDIKKRKAGVCNILVNELINYTSSAVVIKLLCSDFTPNELIKEFGFSKEEVDEVLREDQGECSWNK